MHAQCGGGGGLRALGSAGHPHTSLLQQHLLSRKTHCPVTRLRRGPTPAAPSPPSSSGHAGALEAGHAGRCPWSARARCSPRGGQPGTPARGPPGSPSAGQTQLPAQAPQRVSVSVGSPGRAPWEPAGLRRSSAQGGAGASRGGPACGAAHRRCAVSGRELPPPRVYGVDTQGRSWLPSNPGKPRPKPAWSPGLMAKSLLTLGVSRCGPLAGLLRDNRPPLRRGPFHSPSAREGNPPLGPEQGGGGPPAGLHRLRRSWAGSHATQDEGRSSPQPPRVHAQSSSALPVTLGGAWQASVFMPLSHHAPQGRQAPLAMWQGWPPPRPPSLDCSWSCRLSGRRVRGGAARAARALRPHSRVLCVPWPGSLGSSASESCPGLHCLPQLPAAPGDLGHGHWGLRWAPAPVTGNRIKGTRRGQSRREAAPQRRRQNLSGGPHAISWAGTGEGLPKLKVKAPPQAQLLGHTESEGTDGRRHSVQPPPTPPPVPAPQPGARPLSLQSPRGPRVLVVGLCQGPCGGGRPSSPQALGVPPSRCCCCSGAPPLLSAHFGWT